MSYKVLLYIIIISIIHFNYTIITYENNYNINLKYSNDINSKKSNNINEISIKSGENIGKITIEKINLELPIIEEASEENLKLGATHVLYTPLPWEDGNCFISAHRSWNYGIMFNRLNELKNGDIIQIFTQKKHFKYKVVNQEIVKPDNVDVFKKKYDLTLTTCTPIYTPTHRLIIYCEKI